MSCHGQRLPGVSQPKTGLCRHCGVERRFDYVVHGIISYWRCSVCEVGEVASIHFQIVPREDVFMRALTVCQPYPELILVGEKPIENREWATAYRGELLIHAGKSRTWLTTDALRRSSSLVFGAIVGVATLVDCLELKSASWPVPYQRLKDHEHANGPWCWILVDVKRFPTPVPCRGALGLWTPPADVQPAILQQLRAVA